LAEGEGSEAFWRGFSEIDWYLLVRLFVAIDPWRMIRAWLFKSSSQAFRERKAPAGP